MAIAADAMDSPIVLPLIVKFLVLCVLTEYHVFDHVMGNQMLVDF